MRRGRLREILPAAVLAVFAAVSLSGRIHATFPPQMAAAVPSETPYVATPSPSPSATPAPPPTPAPKPVPEIREYEQGVESGSIRYVWQLQEADKNGWGKYAWKAGAECTTACISMALSYLGIDESPEALLDFSSTTYLQSCYGMEDRIAVSPCASPVYEDGEAGKAFAAMFEAYMNDREGIWSPVLIYFSGNGHSHAVVVIGQDGEDYLVADPTPKGMHRIRITEEGQITAAEADYLTRYIPSEDGSVKIVSLAQWQMTASG